MFSVEVVQVAVPLCKRLRLATGDVSAADLNATFPVGVPVAGAVAATDAERTTGSLNLDAGTAARGGRGGRGADVLTTVGEVLVAKLNEPEYTAVRFWAPLASSVVSRRSDTERHGLGSTVGDGGAAGLERHGPGRGTGGRGDGRGERDGAAEARGVRVGSEPGRGHGRVHGLRERRCRRR